MIKKVVVILITIFSCSSFAQQGTASPYSFYGIGSLKFKGTVENRMMGGISVYMDSIHLNLRNPASYAGKNIEAAPYDGESRPVKFAVAGTFNTLNLKTNNSKESTSTAVFDYIALSFPAGKLGFGFGLLPFTSVGYKLQDTDDDGNLLNRYQGEGGLNKAYFGVGYQLSPKFRIGADVNYNFGRIENSALAFVYNEDGELVQFQTSENNRSDLSGLNINFGAIYKTKISDKLDFSATATFAPESNLSSENQRSISTVAVNGNGDEFVQDTIEVELDNGSQNLRETDLSLPYRLSFGAGIGEAQKWFIGAEYEAQNTSVYANPLITDSGTEFENASRISIGGFYLPDYNSFSKYLNRVVYRAGFNFGNSGLVVNNESINEFGMSFGLGLPVGANLGGVFSELNVGFEYGQRGTTDSNLVKENFFNLNLSLSLSDRWFRKRKYN
ncbi:hypothetical protein Q2T40_15475 [Winogradskyella maritima]|uniref:Long-subunit fatty acid transport protein n=1 Tax=Winogradskyella maritima TaxID=1517766 RepID=A0ABV8AFH8_9FLAO|nr:hypothetical protein [Winogradskyella maritima]